MTITSASDAIASLLEMAEQGEIDPWDVQVIDVIDRFLA
ncbi:MAG: segregation/condensation protein A, partial [Microcystis sp.]